MRVADADQKLRKPVSDLDRRVTLPLTVYGGRVFAESATPDKVDGGGIELKCWWQDVARIFDLSVVIGNEQHPPAPSRYDYDEDAAARSKRREEEETGWRLSDCPVMLTIHRAEPGYFEGNKADERGGPILGQFKYYAPIRASDGVVNDRRPTITAWVGMGGENYRLIRERLLAGEQFDFDVGITARFPEAAVENGWVGRTVHWDGEEPLPITGATVVWRRNDWDADHDRKPSSWRSRQEIEYVPPREHVEVMDVTRRIETALSKLATPLWLAAGAAVLALIGASR